MQPHKSSDSCACSSPWRVQQPALEREHIQQLLCTHEQSGPAWGKSQVGCHEQVLFIWSSILHGNVVGVLNLFSC